MQYPDVEKVAPYVGKFLSSLGRFSFSGRTLLHGVSSRTSSCGNYHDLFGIVEEWGGGVITTSNVGSVVAFLSFSRQMAAQQAASARQSPLVCSATYPLQLK
jgi:hypothetical protein